MAVWRRRPKDSVIIHSDQGSQFGSDEFSRWCKDNRQSPSMSRRGNCWDNAVTGSVKLRYKKCLEVWGNATVNQCFSAYVIARSAGLKAQVDGLSRAWKR